MRNITKFLGIIAAVAMIGMMTGCPEPDADDRVELNITGYPADAEGFFAMVSLYKKADDTSSVARGSALKQISNRATRSDMVQSGKNFADEGSYFIRIEIYPTGASEDTKDRIYEGWTTANRAIVKGTNTYSADIFDKNPALMTFKFPQPPVSFFGTYTAAGYAQNVTETVVFTQTTFKISDNENTPADFLNFTIEKWDDATVPPTYATSYPRGYKFTGVITGGKEIIEPNASANPPVVGSIYGSQTAPGFGSSDVNTTKCHMYIYAAGSGNSFTFIRTTITKEGATTDNTTPVMAGASTSTTPRVFTKQP